LIKLTGVGETEVLRPIGGKRNSIFIIMSMIRERERNMHALTRAPFVSAICIFYYYL